STIGKHSALWTFPSLCLNPLNAVFPYSGGLLAFSAAGAIWAVMKDRRRSGSIALWWLGGGVLVTLFPISIFPYRSALQFQPRMLAVLTLPGALLASVFVVEALGSAHPRRAWVAAAGASLLSLACAVRIHQDGWLWRQGVEWAHRTLADHPGKVVVTDPRAAEMLLMLSSYAPAYRVRGYASGDAPPESGTLLLDVPRQAAASRLWDGIAPPGW